MRYTRTLDIWGLAPEQRAKLQPGQWITAGGAIGRYMGQRPCGVDVVAWRGNRPKGAKGRAYDAALREYAKG